MVDGGWWMVVYIGINLTNAVTNLRSYGHQPNHDLDEIIRLSAKVTPCNVILIGSLAHGDLENSDIHNSPSTIYHLPSTKSNPSPELESEIFQ